MMVSLEYNAYKDMPTWLNNPLDRLYQLWPEIMEATRVNSLPHIIGEMEIQAKTITDVRLDVILKENPDELVVIENEKVYFMFPVEVTAGIEGVYLKLLSVLR